MEDETTTLDPTLEIAAFAGALEAARGSGARLFKALDSILPVARAYMAIAADAGGPGLDRLIADPEDPASTIMPEILDAEETLFACANAFAVGDRPEPADFELLEFDDLVDETLIKDETPRQGDPLEDAARQILQRIEAGRARRIAGMTADPTGLTQALQAMRAAIDAAIGSPVLAPAPSVESAAPQAVVSILKQVIRYTKRTRS
jgi:hypothetical protein